MLRGNALAKVDDKGRLKLPSVYRSIIEPRFGNEFFVTSLDGKSVHLYPMEVYTAIEERFLGVSKLAPAVTRFRNVLNYYGQTAIMDAQGRILIHPLLREHAAIRGEVAVLGQQNYLEVWNRQSFEVHLQQDPLTDADRQQLASLGF
jgi:MraZ protein